MYVSSWAQETQFACHSPATTEKSVNVKSNNLIKNFMATCHSICSLLLQLALTKKNKEKYFITSVADNCGRGEGKQGRVENIFM